MLTENQVLEKERKQLEEMQERREQLQMLMQWYYEDNGERLKKLLGVIAYNKTHKDGT